MRSVVWFRGKDLRVHDHPALIRASKLSRELLPVFVLEPEYLGSPAGAARAPHRVQFLLEALEELGANLAAMGSGLLTLEGPASTALPAVVARFKADHVFTIGHCEPGGRARDEAVAKALPVPLELCGYETLLPPGSIRSRSGGPFQVYTPFARAAVALLEPPAVRKPPRNLPPMPQAEDAQAKRSLPIPTLRTLELTHNPHLQSGGERAALLRLSAFIRKPAPHYPELRDRMDLAGTSRLSADLHFGTLSIRQVYAAAEHALAVAVPEAWQRYRGELLWREFSHHTLFDRPELLREPFRKDFVGFPYRDDDAGWDAWVEGKTGYPVVDAAARQLLHEGFVHNRARMISASFLTKHLAIAYRRGERHYLQFLTDGDFAQNNMGWQWSAGSGCDAQPYFRIFNPVTQGERFDPDGRYVRRYVPELAALPDKYIHAPWKAPSSVLRAANIELGKDYPEPVVDHDEGRQRFLLMAAEHLGAKRNARSSASPSAQTGTRR